MAVDHAAVFLIYVNGRGSLPFWGEVGTAMRLVGRVAFPLYAFMLVQGFLCTRDWRKYLARLAVLAVISEIPYNLVATGRVFFPGQQNTVLLLCIGLAAIKGISAVTSGGAAGWPGGFVERRHVRGRKKAAGAEQAASGGASCGHAGGGWPCGSAGGSAGDCQVTPAESESWTRMAACALIAVSAMLLAWAMRADYGAMGILFILALYWFRNFPAARFTAGSIILVLSEGPFYAPFAWIAFFFMNRYNGEKGRNLGRLPYVFYPAHLLIIYTAGVLFL